MDRVLIRNKIKKHRKKLYILKTKALYKIISMFDSQNYVSILHKPCVSNLTQAFCKDSYTCVRTFIQGLCKCFTQALCKHL